MMIIQLVLVIVFLYLLLKFLANPASTKMRAWKKIIGMVLVMGAIFVIIFPQTANDVAHFVGVGRGADLLLYVLTVAVILAGINLYIKSQQDNQRLVKIARKQAIMEANIRYKQL